jgi:thiol:disulfide interchange protein DsbD
VVLAFAFWIWGQFVQKSTRHQGLAIAAALLVAAFGYGLCLEKELGWRTPPAARPFSAYGKTSPDGIDWQPWSQAAVEKARAEGHPVLVDFTAKTCLICQANKTTSIEIPSVRARIKATNTVPLLGDFTQEDPAIAAELKRFSRAGVPLVLLYPRDPERDPIVLPSILTPAVVLSALDEAAK